MELYQFTWGGGSDDECYSFFANADYGPVINLMANFRNSDGDIWDYDEFEKYAGECGMEITRYCHEEPTYIYENDLEEILK